MLSFDFVPAISTGSRPSAGVLHQLHGVPPGLSPGSVVPMTSGLGQSCLPEIFVCPPAAEAKSGVTAGARRRAFIDRYLRRIEFLWCALSVWPVCAADGTRKKENREEGNWNEEKGKRKAARLENDFGFEILKKKRADRGEKGKSEK